MADKKWIEEKRAIVLEMESYGDHHVKHWGKGIPYIKK